MAIKSNVKSVLKVEKVPMDIEGISPIAEALATEMAANGTMKMKTTIKNTSVSIGFREDQDFCAITFHSESNAITPSFHTYRFRTQGEMS